MSEPVPDPRDESALAALRKVKNGIRHHLIVNLTYRETSKDPKGNGFTFAEVSDWQLRDWLAAIDAALPTPQ